MLACPLTYKGGAELPHAHALFQLLFDAAHGSIDHHHDGDAADDDDAPPQITAHLPSLGALTGSRVSPMTESADGLSLALALAAGWWRARGGGALAAGNSRRLTGQHPAPDPPPPRRSPAVF
ncbi:MAG TPA: hypothetical protein VFQ80_00675 [Thermomicrobiales bacterium]|jgi:hypothetical protein|nr:hypothetical protein [Thermomicrobiales bacterium]